MLNGTMIVHCNRNEKPIFKSELYLKWISEMEFYKPFDDAEQNKIVEFLSKDYALFNSKNDTDFLLDISNGIETNRVSIRIFTKSLDDSKQLHVFFSELKKPKEIEVSPLFDEILSKISEEDMDKASKMLNDNYPSENESTES
jgi:hypothetical protein